MLPIYIARQIVLPQIDVSGRKLSHPYVGYENF